MLVTLIGVVDYQTGFTLFFEAFYLVPVGLAAWYVSGWAGALTALVSVAVWMGGDFAAGMKYQNVFAPIWNGAIAFTVYLVVVRTLVNLRRLQQELAERVRQRTAALAAEMQERARLEKELVEIGEQSQRQIGHELHDTLGQQLTAAAFAGQVLTGELQEQRLPAAAAAQKVVGMVENAIKLTRQLAHGLQPVELNPEGLMDGFQELARRISEQYRIQCEFECRQPVLLHDAQSSTQLYRIAQEAVTNAIRHASPRCLNISLETNAQETVLEVTDDGSGLPAALPGNGLGLRIMAYRAAMIGATFQIERLPEAGTRVSVRLPKNSREMNPQRG